MAYNEPRAPKALWWICQYLCDLERNLLQIYSIGVEATISGLLDTTYKGGIFTLCIHFPPEFPLKLPKVHFRTPIFHPNVSHRDNIFHPMLMPETWCITTSVAQMMMTLATMLIHPLVDEGDMVMYWEDRVRFEEHTRSWTQIYTMD
ncbi:hypothetical protein EUTSA_v10011132mg [Eutrema salsugineum]|uniref:UBC core domain-containing protein n=1 Tax=Eutrema salsugineum TaxID=72664 RepID=V4LTU1_EUTSA|nr:ubiquitin-conjugating enzyme E2 28 [Eutrema salsugineum]ESQ45932.1 hypothetical protein EUTSA_v10011132mg [Eutrema salsugineum]